MASPNWTTTPPTEPGWYWVRGMFRITVDKSEEFIGVVEIVDYGDDLGLLVLVPGSEVEVELSDYTHWIGPLEVPVSPVGMEHTDGKPEGK